MKWNIYLMLVLGVFISLTRSYAQSNQLFDLDKSNYPTISAKFIAFDSEGKQILSSTKENVSLLENNTPQEIVEVKNPSYVPPKKTSIVLSVDVSGSMTGRSLEIVKKCAKSFVRKIDLEHSECALTRFDHRSFLSSDFTKNRKKLLNHIDKLKPTGGTDFNEAFSHPLTGALDIAKKGTEKKVVILLSDGMGDGKEYQIIGQALLDSITIYCLMIDMNAPDLLKSVAKSTGGQCFEQIETPNDLEEIFNAILDSVQGLKPSSITWRSAMDCDAKRNITYTLNDYRISDTNSVYRTPISQRMKLDAKSGWIQFDQYNNNQKIELTAINHDFVIESFSSKPNTIVAIDQVFPFTIKKGKSASFNIKNNRPVDAYSESLITIKNDQCSSLNIFATTPITKNRKVDINVEFPNGGETLYAGSDTTIKWSGPNYIDNTNLEYSTDGGTSWTPIIHTPQPNSYRWKIPNIKTDQALIRASAQLAPSFVPVKSVDKIMEAKNFFGPWANVNPARTMFLSPYKDNIRVYSIPNGKILHEFQFKNINTLRQNYARFSSDGKSIYVYRTGGIYSMEMFMDRSDFFTHEYDATTFEKIRDLPNLMGKGILREGAQKQLTYLIYRNKHCVQYDFLSGELLDSMATPERLHTFNENIVVTLGHKDHHCTLYDLNTHKFLAKFEVENEIFFARLTSDNRYLMVHSQIPSSTLKSTLTVFDLTTGKKKYSIQTRDNGILSAGTIHPEVLNQNLMLCEQEKNHKHSLLETSTGNVVKEIKWPQDFIYISNDGSSAVSLETPNTASLYLYPAILNLYKIEYEKMGKQLAQDQSNKTFRIIQPKIKATDVTMGTSLVKNNKNVVQANFLINSNNTKVKIDTVYLRGENKDVFGLVSSQPKFIMPLKKRALEFQFTPTKSGHFEAEIVIKTPFDSIVQKISGDGLAPNYKITKRSIHVGQLNVMTSKEVELEGIIKNESSEKIIIRSMELSENENGQFRLPSTKGFKLKPGDSKSIPIIFNPTQRGISATWVRFNTDLPLGDLEIEVTGEGLASRTLQLAGTTFNNETKAPLKTKVRLMTADANTASHSIKTDDKGSFNFTLNADLIYILEASKKGFKTALDTIDLSVPSLNKQIERQLFLEPAEEEEDVIENDSGLFLVGTVTDAANGAPIKAKLTFANESKNASNKGNYRFELKAGISYKIIISANGYLPVTTEYVAPANFSNTEIRKDFQLHFINAGEAIQLENVLFVRSKAELLPESFSSLDMLCKYLIDNVDSKIELAGHTDSRGSKELNLELSTERIETIKKYLTEKGIAKKRISGKGYGGSKPIASNATEESRKLNRRVEFKIVK